jgi:lysophospholipase L1-like esterase
MRALIVALALAVAMTGAFAGDPESCAIPGYLLFGSNDLTRVNTAVTKHRRLTVAVIGTGSSALAGPDGLRSAYPARLEAALQARLPSIAVKVISLVRTRNTTQDLAKAVSKLLIDDKPDLVIWQTGTVDAIRRIDPDAFRIALDEGVDAIHKGGADVILMNMQYSPRTEAMIVLGPYADTMRVVSQQRDVPLFDRLAIMRHWSDVGVFDLYASGKDPEIAYRVHDCIARGIATVIIDAGHLQAVEAKGAQ